MREAIHRLEQEGLVQLTPNKGAVVVGVSEKDLRDIYDIRMKLEGLASRWAAEQITEEDAKSLRDILRTTGILYGKRRSGSASESGFSVS